MVRGAAVLLVMLRNAWPNQFGGAGIVGVTLFFTLSGFLITGRIIREIRKTGQLSFGRFYRNRALRLLPALVLLLAIFVVVELIASPFGGRAQIVPTISGGLFYIADQPFTPVSPGMGHIRTLSVEEQFYFAWPSLLILAVRRGWMGRLILIGLVGWLVVCAASLLIVRNHGGPSSVSELPTSWAEALIAGAALAIYGNRLRPPRWVIVSPAVVVLAVLSLLPDAKGSAWTYLLGGPAITASAGILIMCPASRDRAPSWLVPLRRLGLISDGTYLWNYPVATWLQAAYGTNQLTSIASIPLTIAAALVSWFTVERMMERFKASQAPRVSLLSPANMSGREQH